MEYSVKTPCGSVKGYSSKTEGITAYKGIRYATAGRWEYPVEVTGWEGEYDAKEYGNCSYQPRAFMDESKNPGKAFYYNEFRKGETYRYSEDCLFLNIFTPENVSEESGLPVLLYIHGGGFTGGCGHEKHFDVPVWPKYGVIGVTINYRLGPMGFACLPELSEEAGCTGNYGLYDQMTAIRWVKRNIKAFGGDPDNITIMGQSAGAMSVQQHCLSPMEDGLFAKAVMSSGGGVSKLLSVKGPEKSMEFWKKVMEKAGCTNLTEFRELPAQDLFKAWDDVKKESKGNGCAPVIDGNLITAPGTDILAGQAQHAIPYMLGSTSEDIVPLIIHTMAVKWGVAQPIPSYVWYFDRQLPGDEAGAWHSSDLWYWFGTLENGWRPWEPKDYSLSEQMVRYLTDFARTGNPNSSELTPWNPVSRNHEEVLVLGNRVTHMGKPSKLKMAKTMVTNKAVGE